MSPIWTYAYALVLEQQRQTAGQKYTQQFYHINQLNKWTVNFESKKKKIENNLYEIEFDQANHAHAKDWAKQKKSQQLMKSTSRKC